MPIPGTPLAYERVGRGPSLVLLHGLGASRGVWAPVISRLALARDVIAVDLPGFGASPPLPSEITPHPRALAGAVASLMEDLGLPGARAHVAGNSLGGWVAFELALSGHADTVTAIAPAGLWERPLGPRRESARAMVRALSPVAGLAMRIPAARELALRSSVARPDRVPPAAAAAMLRDYGRAPAFIETNAAMRADVFTDLARIEVPVTLVWPEHDRLVSRPRVIPPGVKEIPLPGAGHVPMWDDPGAVAQALLDGSSARGLAAGDPSASAGTRSASAG